MDGRTLRLLLASIVGLGLGLASCFLLGHGDRYVEIAR